jgi:hypothetical protein
MNDVFQLTIRLLAFAITLFLMLDFIIGCKVQSYKGLLALFLLSILVFIVYYCINKQNFS